jgi:hypothetical protein
MRRATRTSSSTIRTRRSSSSPRLGRDPHWHRFPHPHRSAALVPHGGGDVARPLGLLATVAIIGIVATRRPLLALFRRQNVGAAFRAAPWATSPRASRSAPAT